MPIVDIEVLKKYPNNIFVETGTYRGYTTSMASKYYDRVYTFEIVPELYELCKERFAKEGKTNISNYRRDRWFRALISNNMLIQN